MHASLISKLDNEAQEFSSKCVVSGKGRQEV